MAGFWTYWGREEDNNGYKECFGAFTYKARMWNELYDYMIENADTLLEFRDWLDKNFTAADLVMRQENYKSTNDFLKDLVKEFADEFYKMPDDAPEPVEGEDYVINGHIFKWIDTGEFTVHGNGTIY